MNNKKTTMVLLIFFLIMGCRSMWREDVDWEKKDKEFEDRMVKIAHPYFFYNAIYDKDVDLVRRFLEAGSNPNKCRGENGWVDANPLKVVTESFYKTYDTPNQMPRTLSEPARDVAVLQLLINAGADVNRLPYVWDRVYRYGGRHGGTEAYEEIIRRRKLRKLSIDPELVQVEMDTYVQDANRILKALLEAGADPDKLGHPYPFGYDWKVPFLTDRRANKYFARGTRAINVAIEKGILWESQVDLLLRYTSLDEESLRAAERSNDPAMLEKIRKLWEEQKQREL
jgi:hypothetical protein